MKDAMNTASGREDGAKALKKREKGNQLNVDECCAIEYLAIYKDKRALNFCFRLFCLRKVLSFC